MIKHTLLGLAGAVLVGGTAAAAEPESCGTVRFSDVGWTDITATTGLASVVLQGLGYETRADILSVPVTYQSLRNGDIDVFLVQGTMLPPGADPAAAHRPPKGPLSDRLYRNDSAPAPGGGKRLRFTDVTAAAGLAGETGYGMGAAVGDYDGDGDPDLYVTNFGGNVLWENRGDGTFEDVTAEAGADDPRWSVAAAFFDYDRDGDLDLYVGNYVDFGFAKQVPCFDNAGLVDYCGPKA